MNSPVNVYDQCAATVDCRIPINVVGGTIWPTPDYTAHETIQRLIDGQTSTVSVFYNTYGWGVRTGQYTPTLSPYMTLQVSGPYG